MNDDLSGAVSALLVLGLGSPHRGDDSLGPEVIDALRLSLPMSAHKAVLPCQPSTLMESWQRANKVILVDAVRSGGTPGNILRFDLLQQDLPKELLAVSAHALGVAETLALAKLLGKLPAQLHFIGVVGQDFRVGHSMSAAVEEAKYQIVQELLAEFAGDSI